jgi:helicase-like protein
MDTTSFSLACGDAIRRELERLRGLDAADVIAELGLTTVTPGQVDEWLFAYELQLYYVNRKTDADRVLTHASRVGASGNPAPFQAQRLTGANRLAEISDVIRRVERETIGTPSGRRLAVISGTSLVSHGVDLARLNVQFILGMPSTLAYYVQATSRAGRSAVGLIFTALNRYHLRDRSVFHFFEPTHRHVNALVEPVALNRFSLHGPGKTASGLLAALLICEIARDTQALGPSVAAPADFGKAARAEAWLTDAGPAGERRLRESVYSAFGLRSAVLDPVIAANFRQRIDHELDSLLPSLSGTDPQLQRRLRPRPPTSFRDIDAPADFSANGPIAARMFEMLGGDENDDDLPEMANEDGNT